MKKLVAALLVVLLLGAGGAGWYVWVRPHDRLALARSLMSKGDARAAQLALRSALLADPANAEAHFRLGEVELRLGDPIAAEKELTDARQRGWNAKAVEAPLAQAVLEQGRFAEVLASFSPDGLPPDKAAMVLVARSGAALGLQQTAAARDAAAQAERLAPHALDAALASARAEAAAQDHQATEQAIGRALAIDPQSVDALMLQEKDRRSVGDAAGALASLDAAVAAAPGATQPRLVRADLLMQMGRDPGARADVAALLKQDPGNPAANYMQAELLARAHDFAAADAALESVGPALDKLPRADMLRAVIKANVNQPEQAAEAAAHYLGHEPGDPAAYKLVATLALLAHRPADAADVLNRAVLAGYGDAAVYDVLGRAESALGHADAAVAAAQHAASLAPKDQGILARLAALQLGRGDAADAAGDLQHLLDLEATATLTPVAAAAPTAVPSAPPTAMPTATPVSAPAGAAPDSAGPTSLQTATALVLAALQAGQTDRAAAALERLRKLGATPAEIDMLTGLLRLAQLDLPGAQRALQAALSGPAMTAAQTAAARVNLAGVLELEGQHDQAEATLRQVLGADPTNLQALAALERLLLAAGRRDDAVKALETAHAAAPGNATLTVALADLYERMKQPARALAMLDASSPATPSAAETAQGATAAQAAQAVQAARAQAQLALGKHAEAEASLRQLLAARPRDLGLRRELIALLLGEHDVAGAQTIIDEGLAAQPGAPALLSMSVVAALQSGGLQAALDRADMLASDPANLPAARLLKGETYMAVKQFPQATDAFTAELRSANAPSSVALAAASAERAAGQPDAAAGLLRNYLVTHPDAADVAATLGTLEIGAKRLEAARVFLEQALARQPNNAAVLNNLAWVNEQLHQPQQARAMAQRAWLLSATPQASDTLGWILLGGDAGPPEPGQSGVALDLLREAAAALPNDPSVQYHYAMALKDNGQTLPAAAILGKLVALPAFDEQPQARKLLDTLPHS